jgi:enhancing lycopene biosynthesis protein 2
MTNQLDRKIAVVLCGCGHTDGTEVTEAISALIAITEMGASYVCFAPDIGSDGTTPFEMSKRIARGQVFPLSSLKTSDFDGLVFPGGSGAAKVLSDFAEKGARATAIPEVTRVITEFHAQSKPIGAICIAPVLIALTLGKLSVELTVGENGKTASEIAKTGAQHTVCPVTDYISDRDNKVLTTPAYMYDSASSFEVFTGVRKMIRELVEMA